MKKAAVIGAGFAGLAAAYFLSEKYQVTLFDQKEIGAGASGISSGLFHPYPGEKGRLSWRAEKALQATKQLIDVAENALGRPVASRAPILRLGPILNPGPDVEMLGPDQYLIKSGMTVFAPLYLQGLWMACEKRGARLEIKKITSLGEMEHDLVILAVGAGISSFKEGSNLKISFVKGQVLTCQLSEPLKQSISSKVYTALTQDPYKCHVGATYERESIDDMPDIKKATELLKPQWPVIDCRAGIRVTNPAHYFPIVAQVGPKHYAITALGSRGLLYHAFMASSTLPQSLL